MTWALVTAIAVVYVVVMLRVAYWLGGLLRDAEVFLERASADECTCTRYRLCATCLESLRTTKEAA